MFWSIAAKSGAVQIKEKIQKYKNTRKLKCKNRKIQYCVVNQWGGVLLLRPSSQTFSRRHKTTTVSLHTAHCTSANHTAQCSIHTHVIDCKTNSLLGLVSPQIWPLLHWQGSPGRGPKSPICRHCDLFQSEPYSSCKGFSISAWLLCKGMIPLCA